MAPMAGALLYQAKLGGLGMLEANPSIFGSNVKGGGGAHDRCLGVGVPLRL